MFVGHDFVRYIYIYIQRFCLLLTTIATHKGICFNTDHIRNTQKYRTKNKQSNETLRATSTYHVYTDLCALISGFLAFLVFY